MEASPMKRFFLLPLVLLLSACGSSVEGTYADKEGNTMVLKPKGKLSIHGGNQDLEFDYKVEGTKITVTNPKRKKGFQVVTFWRVLDDGSIRSLDGKRLSKQGK
jgi:hypothetical protein